MGWLIADMALGPTLFLRLFRLPGRRRPPVIACSPLTWIEYTSAKKSRQPAGRLLFFFSFVSGQPGQKPLAALQYILPGLFKVPGVPGVGHISKAASYPLDGDFSKFLLP